MLGFAETFGATVATFIFPSLVGLAVISILAKFLKARYLAAIAIGLYLWFFNDTIDGANLLGVNEGFSGGFFHAALWVLFAVGLIVFLYVDPDLLDSGQATPKLGFAIPLLAALAIGLHGFAEGASISATAVTAPGNDLISAFGGVTAGVAFTLHKALEPMMVGAVYWIYTKDHAKNSQQRIIDLIVVAVVFTLPGIVGGGVSYFLVQAYPAADFTYVYAVALGTSIYAALRLARPLFWEPGSRSESLKVAIFILIGFTLLYTAALLHS